MSTMVREQPSISHTGSQYQAAALVLSRNYCTPITISEFSVIVPNDTIPPRGMALLCGSVAKMFVHVHSHGHETRIDIADVIPCRDYPNALYATLNNAVAANKAAQDKLKTYPTVIEFKTDKSILENEMSKLLTAFRLKYGVSSSDISLKNENGNVYVKITL